MSVLLALFVGIVLFVILLKIVISVAAIAIGLAAAVIVYFAAEKLLGQGR